jgi:hypothetical protein
MWLGKGKGKRKEWEMGVAGWSVESGLVKMGKREQQVSDRKRDRLSN